jgi:O-antigen ligase
MSDTGVEPVLAVGAIVAALLAAAALAAPLGTRGRAAAMLGALVLTPALLLAEIWDSDQVESLRDRPAVALGGAAIGVALVLLAALLVHRRPSWLPVLAVAALPFRVPIAAGGSTASLLVPLYAVIGAGVLAFAVPRLLGREGGEDREPARPLVLLLLGATIVLYAVQAAYSDDFDRALQNVVFFYVPFALLAALLIRVDWTRDVLLRCLAVLVGLAVLFVAIGFVEYATKSLLLNPKVIASNQFETYFRVNSLFFDPNIYGRFLATVMILLTALLLWATRPRVVAGAAALLALLWGGLVLTLSQSSFTALLVGLAVLAALRWRARLVAYAVGAALVLAAVVVVAAPSQLGFDRDANDTTSGRWKLIKGGVELAADRPVQGYGSGSFRREYRRNNKASDQRATAASHTIPVTVAAEQGVIGVALYVALLAAAFTLVLRRARAGPAQAAVAAAFFAVFAHSLMYAAFLEDPLTWTLLGTGVALAAEDP